MFRICGGKALIGDELVDAPISVCDGVVIDDDPSAVEINADGLLVLPGIVDIHGDAFERQIQPRPKVQFPRAMALVETDNQLIANGITTAYHGLTVSWEPGLRSIESARSFIEALRATRPRLSCDTKLHIRWETFALDALDEALAWLDDEDHPIFAINDHTTSMMSGGVQARKIDSSAARSGLPREDYVALMESVWARKEDVPAAIEKAADHIRDIHACLLAHDEMTPSQRENFRRLGAVVSEFPMTVETARAARDANEHTILGAPNVVRGGSHNGALNAADAVVDGYCSVLTSDYYYPAPLQAVFKLVAEHDVAFADAWNLVSKNAAQSANLDDRGEIAPGKRADLVLVNDSDVEMPRVVGCIIAGKMVYDRRVHA